MTIHHSFLTTFVLASAILVPPSHTQPSTAAPQSYAARLHDLESLLGQSSRSRPKLIPYAALLAFQAGDMVKATSYANEALTDAAQAGPDQATQIYYGNEVLGLIAANQGNMSMAKYYLTQSIHIKAGSSIAKFGPNMALASALVAKGEQTAVLDFLELAKPVWQTGLNSILQWQGAIRAGAAPDFGIHLTLAP
jgi:hypothetical protein